MKNFMELIRGILLMIAGVLVIIEASPVDIGAVLMLTGAVSLVVPIEKWQEELRKRLNVKKLTLTSQG